MERAIGPSAYGVLAILENASDQWTKVQLESFERIVIVRLALSSRR